MFTRMVANGTNSWEQDYNLKYKKKLCNDHKSFFQIPTSLQTFYISNLKNLTHTAHNAISMIYDIRQPRNKDCTIRFCDHCTTPLKIRVVF